MSTRNIGLRERRASHSRSAWIASTTGFVRSLLTSNRDCGGLGNLACLLTFVTFRSKTQDKNKTYVLKCCRGKDEHKLFAGRVRGMNECVSRHVVESHLVTSGAARLGLLSGTEGVFVLSRHAVRCNENITRQRRKGFGVFGRLAFVLVLSNFCSAG